MHLLSNILVSKEKSHAEVFGGDVLTIPNDELADASEHDIFDSLCCDPAQVRYEDRSISHPAIYRQINIVVSHHTKIKARPEAAGCKEDEPLLGFQSPQTDLAVVQGRLILNERLSGRTIPIMPRSRPSVISTTGADFEPGSSNDITVQARKER